MRDIKTFIIMIQQIKALLNRKHKRRFLFVAVMIFISALFETIGVSAILPLIQVLLMPDHLMRNSYVQIVMNILHLHTSLQLTILIGIGVAALYLVKNIFMVLVVYIKVNYAGSVNKDLASLVMASYMERNYEFFTTHTTADIMRGVEVDANSVFNVIGSFLEIATCAMTTACVGVFLFKTDYILCTSIILIGLVSILLTMLLFKKKMAQLGELNRQAHAAVSAVTIQIVQGIKEIFMKQKRGYFIEQFQTAKEKKKKADVGFQVLNALPMRFIESLSVLVIIIALLIRIIMGVDSQEFILSLGVFAMAGFKVMPYIANISSSLTNLAYFRASLEATYENVMEVHAYARSHTKTVKQESTDKQTVFANKIELKHVRWRYEKGEKDILSDLNLTIYKGEIIGIIGESGAGKSTISDILLGLYEPQKGTVEMDGINIYTHPNMWSAMIGYVPQSTYLFDDSIRRNVAFGDTSPDDDKVWDALEKASLKDFVESLPDGLDTHVGEQGIMLSGGQRQRVAIARALYSEPQILVLDEATSALDNETEATVMEAIESLQGMVTMIIIAHRLTTIKNCDRIYEITEGKAIERNKKEVLSID